MESSKTGWRTSGRAMASGAAVALAGLLAALALVSTNATGVTEVADDATLLQQVESALGGAAAAQNAIGQALLLTGPPDDPTLAAAAVAEARSVLASLAQRVAAVSAGLDDPASLDAAVAAALADASSVLDALAVGDLDLAGGLATGSSSVSFGDLVDQLVTFRGDLAERISQAAAESGTVATASRFMVAFFVPSAAIIVVFLTARRRRRRERLSIALEHERAVNASKDQLIANLSHELRTPLTGIYTSALAMEDMEFSDTALTRELNDMIINQSADLTRMVEDLLVSAQADAGRLRFELSPTPVAELAAGLAAEFERTGAKLDLRLEPGHALADPGRLRQLMRNLISNAVRHGGDQIGIRGRVAGSSYVIEVIDDGPGVPPEVEERLFERFVHRGDQPLIVGSVGLGLAITKVLADGMNGSITHHREAGHTSFEVILERAIDPAANLPPDPAPTETPHLVADEEKGHIGG
ncbi:MAG: HAMP domain-containing sensor histidine kinase [Acidimicrobiia bacterium]